jgi:hypothetical protein
MSESAMGYVVKLLDDNRKMDPRWVTTEGGRGFGTREGATVFPDREAAESEAKVWKAMPRIPFSVVVEPA